MGSDVWTLTGTDQNQTYNSELYIATAMKRGGYEQKNELSKANLDLSLPIDHELSVSLLTVYTEQIMSLTVFSNIDGTVSTIWKGRLVSVKPSDTELTLTFESIFTSLQRPGLRARFQKSCRHALYGRGCTLDPADFEVLGATTAFSGNTLTVTEAGTYANGYFIGGMLAAPDGTLSYVINHVGTSITLQRTSYSLLTAWAETGAGMVVKLYPGCDHSRNTCNTKFGNLLNYGGFDWIPEKNPMGGSSVY